MFVTVSFVRCHLLKFDTLDKKNGVMGCHNKILTVLGLKSYLVAVAFDMFDVATAADHTFLATDWKKELNFVLTDICVALLSRSCVLLGTRSPNIFA